MFRKILLFTFFISFSQFVDAQTATKQDRKSKPNSSAVMQIAPANTKSSKSTSPPTYYNSKQHRKTKPAQPSQRVGMKATSGDTYQELAALNAKLAYLKKQPITPTINAEIAQIESAIKQQQQKINAKK